ncbi:hypothetical protein KEM60_00114 [Austwickia sp. TVS 96-490-7B]|uniref:hypothetical protein n=1 Tax=Austwickia sp. TVS 96-490-7B TaxID=2830843 RepID=UPI001C56F38B|nr:hypothetical protein [Austwickia sp. TVS 96-490-7B]MBW3083932.1 hypothetical protein [Austwickia sp. TVS 96-490-7B]
MSGEKARRRQLGTLLRIRRLEEDLAKGELARANALIRRQQDQLAQARQAYQQQTAPPEVCDVRDFQAQLARNRSVAAMVRGSERAVTDAVDEAARTRDRVRLARIKTQGLERLVERVDQVVFAEMLAADQRTAEESRASRHTKGNR